MSFPPHTFASVCSVHPAEVNACYVHPPFEKSIRHWKYIFIQPPIFHLPSLPRPVYGICAHWKSKFKRYHRLAKVGVVSSTNQQSINRPHRQTTKLRQPDTEVRKFAHPCPNVGYVRCYFCKLSSLNNFGKLESVLSGDHIHACFVRPIHPVPCTDYAISFRFDCRFVRCLFALFALPCTCVIHEIFFYPVMPTVFLCIIRVHWKINHLIPPELVLRILLAVSAFVGYADKVRIRIHWKSFQSPTLYIWVGLG